MPSLFVFDTPCARASAPTVVDNTGDGEPARGPHATVTRLLGLDDDSDDEAAPALEARRGLPGRDRDWGDYKRFNFTKDELDWLGHMEDCGEDLEDTEHALRLQIKQYMCDFFYHV
jgi:hypothetical protein